MADVVEWVKMIPTHLYICIYVRTFSYVVIKQTQAFVGRAVVDHVRERELRDKTPAANHVTARSSSRFRWSWLNAYRDVYCP